MRIVRLLPRAATILVFAAATGAAACSSDSATAPTTAQNVKILSRFDSLANQTPDPLRADALAQIAQLLAQGAPVGTGTIRVNGVGGPFTMIAALEVTSIGGQPVDSQYTVAGWEGNAPDSVVLLTLHDGEVSAIVSEHHGSVAGPGGTATITVQSGGASCTSFAGQAPPDLDVPTPSSCSEQRSQMTFSSTFGNSPTITVDMPAQTVMGIRLVFDTPAA
ncbi:MAG TPA: hypothetical protein VGR59_06345 [Gemmatimonadaceae bacterium]|nr:hypothetical protein [Gemmatimonadaceae bacterium]